MGKELKEILPVLRRSREGPRVETPEPITEIYEINALDGAILEILDEGDIVMHRYTVNFSFPDLPPGGFRRAIGYSEPYEFKPQETEPHRIEDYQAALIEFNARLAQAGPGDVLPQIKPSFEWTEKDSYENQMQNLLHTIKDNIRRGGVKTFQWGRRQFEEDVMLYSALAELAEEVKKFKFLQQVTGSDAKFLKECRKKYRRLELRKKLLEGIKRRRESEKVIDMSQ